nr:mast cell protease 3-like [Pelodiscus sinensis]|eukprot:XP_025044690.1 mast cell protease 3-like [Pelodiscus sinensis]
MPSEKVLCRRIRILLSEGESGRRDSRDTAAEPSRKGPSGTKDLQKRRCEAQPHSRPYMAFLEIQDGDENYTSSGFLVAEKFVLTAAHCRGDKIAVILGAHDVTKQEPSQQRIRVRRQIPHPQYDRENLKNDIMLLQSQRLLTGRWRCEAQPHSRPYMAFLEIQDGDENYTSSGFLVAEKFVLTAAHCRGDKIAVILGAHDVTKQEPSQQRIRVRRQIPHPQYDRENLKNDIMLLQLEKPAKLNGFVKTIPLPEPGERVEPGTACSVAGWGRTIGASNVLQEVDVEVLEDDECLKYDYYDPATMLSARHPQKCRDTARVNLLLA